MSGRIMLAAPAGESDSVVQALVVPLRAAAFQVATLDLDHRHSDRELEECFMAGLVAMGGADVVGGFSLGARIAARVAGAARARGLLCISYPFHRRGEPTDAHGLASLELLRLPTLILQGTRDSHGGRSTLKGFGELSNNIEVHWLQDANHRLMPRQKTGLTREGHLQEAARVSLDFVQRILVV